MTGPSPAVLTVGHSTRTLEAFVHLLQVHAVRRVVDVRTVPRSRHNPQFNRETLPDALQAAGIAYTHMAGLGGLRHSRSDSPNTAWRNASFQGFADYMQTPEFAANLNALMELAFHQRYKQDRTEEKAWSRPPWTQSETNEIHLTPVVWQYTYFPDAKASDSTFSAAGGAGGSASEGASSEPVSFPARRSCF